MIYGEKTRDPLRYYGGAAAVVLIHLVLIGALLRGLDHQPAPLMPAPLRVFIVADRAAPAIQPPPARPRPAPRPVPRPAPVPPSPLARPAPVPAPAPAAAPAALPPSQSTALPKPAPAAAHVPNRNVAAVCPNLAGLGKSMVYPVAALRRGVNSGQVVVEFTIDAGGHTRDFVIQQSSDGVFNRAALELAHKLDCLGQGQDVRVQLPVAFRAGE